MTQLRSCYFCGTVGDSLREYEVVPERFVSSGGPRTAVLCSSCHGKLRRVLEPLATAADAATSGTDDGDGSASVQEVTFDSDAESGGDGALRDEESGASTDREPPNGDGTGDGDTGGDGPNEGADSDDAPAAASGDADEDVPDEYYKVIRLLQNREFPMERADLTALVTGAYDVSKHECDRILETAIERGVLVERGTTLDTGGD
jgi:hypothetical protein